MIKKGMIFASKRDKTIPIRNIASVEVKKPGSLVAGFIQFGIAGAHARDSSFTFTGGTFGAAQDENSVVFGGMASYRVALQIKEYIENFREDGPVGTPSPIAAAAQGAVTADSVLDQLERLGKLKAQGVVTEEEFREQKAKLLGHSLEPSPTPPTQPRATPSAPALENDDHLIVSCPFCARKLMVPALMTRRYAKCSRCGGTIDLSSAQ